MKVHLQELQTMDCCAAFGKLTAEERAEMVMALGFIVMGWQKYKMCGTL